MSSTTVRPDSKGRISLGSLTKGVSSFSVHTEKDGTIILEPFVEIPAKEQWLYQNKQATQKVKKGLQESDEGKLTSRGSFSKFKDDELD